MQESAYREKYGLSYSQFIREPIKVYKKALDVMSVESDIQRAERAKAERSSNR